VPAAAPVPGEDFMDTSERSRKRQATKQERRVLLLCEARGRRGHGKRALPGSGSFRRRVWAWLCRPISSDYWAVEYLLRLPSVTGFALAT
jgi:hypothetical protein